MASRRKTFQRIAEQLVFSEAPKLVRQLQKPDSLPRSIQQGIKIGIDAGWQRSRGHSQPGAGRRYRRPSGHQSSVPTAHRARGSSTAPDLDGRADPGEIVWTWVAYEEDPTRARTGRCWSSAATARRCSA